MSVTAIVDDDDDLVVPPSKGDVSDAADVSASRMTRASSSASTARAASPPAADIDDIYIYLIFTARDQCTSIRFGDSHDSSRLGVVQ